MGIDTAVQAANRTTEAGAAAGVVGFITQINWIGLGGFIIAALGGLASIYYQRRRDKRELEKAELEKAESAARLAWGQAESDARIAALRDRCGL